jgi:hypothetical protein
MNWKIRNGERREAQGRGPHLVNRREHGVGADGALEQLVHAAGAAALGVRPGGRGGEESAEAEGGGVIHVRGGGVGQRDALDATHVHGAPAHRRPRTRSASAGRVEAGRRGVRRFVARRSTVRAPRMPGGGGL